MRRLLAFLLIVSLPCFGAFGTATVWEVTTSGADTNGGAFDSGVGSPGTDESLGAGTAITVTLTGTTTGTCSPACTSTTHGPGNFIYIASGSGCTTSAWYEILSQSSGTITVTPAMGSSTDVCVGTIGGALASPGAATGQMVGKNTLWIGTGTYTLTSATQNVSGGPMKCPAGTNAPHTSIFGYNTSRWSTSTGPTASDYANRPVISAGSESSINILDITAGDCNVENLVLNGNSQASVTGLIATTGSNDYISRVLVENFTVYGFELGPAQTAWLLEATGGTSCTAGISSNGAGSRVSQSVSHGNACSGFYAATQAITWIQSLSYGNTGSTGYGFEGATTPIEFVCINCTSFGNAETGFQWNASGYNSACINCVSYGDGTTAGYGFSNSVSAVNLPLINCAAGGEGTGNTHNITYMENFISLGSNPFSGSGSGNFAPGSALQALGIPGVLPPGNSTGYIDIGALQHQNPSGGAIVPVYPIQ